MTLMKTFRSYYPLSIGSPGHQVRPRTGLNHSHAVGTTQQLGRRGAHPSAEVLNTETATFGLGPYTREAQLQRRNTTPGRFKIAQIQMLQTGNAGAMVGYHLVNDPILQALPKRLSIVLTTNRWPHLNWVAPSGPPPPSDTDNADKSLP